VKCSKGTYVRVLGEDIGALLGCGAHLSALRRVQVGSLGTVNMVTLDELQAHENPLSLLAPVDALLSTFPRVDLTPELEKRFLNGQRLALGKEPVVVPAEQGRVRVYADGRLLGTAILQEYAILAPERLVSRTVPS
jgi:tRNA pseudouridine55 synthase